jgi:streptogramin lyase
MADHPLRASFCLAVAVATLAALHLGCGGADGAPSDDGWKPGDPRITRFYLTPHSGAWMIAAGPDGNLWFTERGHTSSDVTRIGRITLTGELTERPLAPGSQPWGITAGPDDAVWFADYGAQAIGRIARDGTIQAFPLPTANARPIDITLGNDGNLWFTETTTTTNLDPMGNVARITPAGEVTEFPVGTMPSQIAAGPDGNIWYVAWYHTAIGRLTPTGEVTEFPLPRSCFPHGLAAGPDGALWVTEATGVGRLSLDGAHTAFAVPGSVDDSFGDIIAGPDGALWFAADSAGAVGRVTTDGAISVVPFENGLISPVTGIAAADDGSLWLTDGVNDLVVRFRP